MKRAYPFLFSLSILLILSACRTDPPVILDPDIDTSTYVTFVDLPLNYDAGQSWPLLLFLHDEGSNTASGPLAATYGPLAHADTTLRNFPFIVLAPQLSLIHI